MVPAAAAAAARVVKARVGPRREAVGGILVQNAGILRHEKRICQVFADVANKVKLLRTSSMSPTADTASVDLLLPIMDMPLFFFFSTAAVALEDEEEAFGVEVDKRGVLGLLPLLLAEEPELVTEDLGSGSTVAVVTVSFFVLLQSRGEGRSSSTASLLRERLC